MSSKIPPIHPGEILVEEFLEPLEITPYALAKALDVPQPRIYAIAKRERGITADTAVRLAKFFGTSEEFWMNLQSHYDLEVQRDTATMRKAVSKIVPFSDIVLRDSLTGRQTVVSVKSNIKPQPVSPKWRPLAASGGGEAMAPATARGGAKPRASAK